MSKHRLAFQVDINLTVFGEHHAQRTSACLRANQLSFSFKTFPPVSSHNYLLLTLIWKTASIVSRKMWICDYFHFNNKKQERKKNS